VTNEAGGSVAITVFDDNGCSQTATQVVAPFNAITDASVTIDKAIDCATGEDITINFTSVSAIPNVEYSVTGINGTVYPTVTQTAPMPNPEVFTGLGTGVYEIAIFNPDTGCTFTIVHQVDTPPTFNLDVDKTSDVACFGTATGEISFEFSSTTPYGGLYNYEVFQSSGVTTGITNTGVSGLSTVGNLLEGEYYVVVTMTGSPFCPVQSTNVTINGPTTGLAMSYETTLISCITSNSGEVNINATGGWGSYTYQLINTTTGVTIQSFDTNKIIKDLEAGDYEITVQDTNGCQVTDTFTLEDPTPIVATLFEAASNQCEGDESATIQVNSISGGQGNPANYTFTLTYPSGNTSARQLSNEFTGLGSGNYVVTVYDEYSCSQQFPVTISDPTEVIASAVANGIITCNNTTVDVVVSGTGGTGAYTYSNNGTVFGVSDTFPMAAGQHNFYVRDANGCTSEPYIITIAELVPLTVTLNTSGGFITCNDEANAVLSATVTGGLGNNIYELLDGTGSVVAGPQASNNTFTNIGPGIYSIRVTSQDCIAVTGTYEITNPEELVATGTPTAVSCNGGSNGSIAVNAEGGTGTYVYEISSEPGRFQSQNVFNNLPAGIYDVTVQDDRGCYDIIQVEVIEPELLTVDLVGTVNQQLCIGDTAPSFEVVISGGTGPYRVSLNGEPFVDLPIGANTHTFNNLIGGVTYVVLVRDSNDCAPIEPIVVTPNAPIDFQFAVERIYDCSGSATITATVAEQYINEVIYTLSGPENTSNDTGIFNVNLPGLYTVEVEHVRTDGAQSCIEISEEIEVAIINPLVFTIDASEKNKFIVNASGGLPPYEYSFDGGETFSYSNESLITQTRDYEIVVRDARSTDDNEGCPVSQIVEGVYITIEIPNFFTPDGDGTNDYWYPINVEDYHDVTIYIFDRYGRQLEIFTGSHQGWDGIYQGRPLPSGDYWYTINFKELSGEARKFMGHFTLYR
ncbi:T9SS type B sorting domain-containing protein, partial [Tenacibaculum adriaticum]|uniref:T9SS type B sorting domain-containing protein n=1 Tax=Tenacibaculum adriaticum TaxID=413713 RepID=UPI0011E70F25